MLLETFKTKKLRYLLTLFSLLCLFVLPHDAYAVDQGYGSFWYGPDGKTANGVEYYKTGVVASNKYDAALYALGFSKSTVSGISNSKKQKLIGNSTFSAFANKFVTGKPDDDLTSTIPGVPTVGLNTDSMLSAWYAASAMYSSGNCFWSVYSKDAADTAEDAAFTIIKGGSSTGGGSGGNPGTNNTDFPTQRAIIVGDYALLPVVNWVADWTHVITYVAVKKSVFYDASEFALANGQVLLAFYGGYIGNSSRDSITLISCPYSAVDFVSNGKYIQYTSSFAGVRGYYLLRQDVTFETIAGYNCAVTNGSGNVGIGEASKDYTNPAAYVSWIYPEESEVDPPVGWPVEPPTPTPPTPPDPVEPDPPTPWNPIPDIDIDITGDDFQDLLDALNEHCIHLQTSITNNVSQLWQLQSELFSNHMNTFWDNLHKDLLWLGECLNFDVNVNVDGGSGDGSEGEGTDYVPFDDSSVIYWLKQIWSKLGNGISTRPVDPVVNPNGWWDWFSGLLAGLIGSLADIGLDKIGGLVDALDTLKDKFPFCIPWDIAALLGLLVSEPVTPVVQVPLMALSVSDGVQQVGTMVIDLESYNDVWDAVRWIERIAFCVYLATRTKDFLDLLGKIKG